MAKDHTLVLEAGEIRIKAERRLGEMLIEQSQRGRMSKGAATKGVGRKGKKAKSIPGSSGDPQITLEELGIGKALADRARRMARMEEPEFAAFVARWRDGKRLKDLQEERMRLGVKRIVERSKKIDARKFGVFIDGTLEEDGVPEKFASMLQLWEWRLRSNPSALDLPENVNSVSRVVADALWRLNILADFAGDYDRAMVLFVDIMERMDARVVKIMKQFVDGADPTLVPSEQPEKATSSTEQATASP